MQWEGDLEDEVKNLLAGEEPDSRKLKAELEKNLESTQTETLDFLKQIKSKKKQLMAQLGFLETQYDGLLEDIEEVFDGLQDSKGLRGIRF